MSFTVNSDRVTVTDDEILARYDYHTTSVVKDAEGRISVTPVSHQYTFKTNKKVPKTGVMFVGWGGNNGTTVTGGIIANRENITWRTKEKTHTPDYFGSLSQASTVRLGNTADGEEIHIPFKDLLPMVAPNDLVIGGWDINGANMAQAMERAQVLNYDLQRQLVPHLEKLKPLPSIYYPDFIAANQEDRADNVIPGQKASQEHVDRIRADIRKFKADNGLDTVIVLWTANTERFADVTPGVHDTVDNLLKAIVEGHEEVAPSQIFAVASILEGCAYINGSPQNTFVPAVVALSERERVFIGGDDFKSGQTKIKSVLVDFLVGAGIKPESIVSYNHLGNNDGKNLSSQRQFRSKEISKSNVVDDMVNSNRILYKEGEHPDHCVVIKYVPHVADSKRAMDEYTSSIFLGGKNTIVMHNTCEDSLLAAPLIIDLVVFTELLQRITYKTQATQDFETLSPILSVLSYLLKAPMVPKGTPVVNALMAQRACLINLLRACSGLPPQNDMLLEHKTKCPSISQSLKISGDQKIASAIPSFANTAVTGA